MKNVTMFWRIYGSCRGTIPEQRVVIADTLDSNVVSNINEELALYLNLFGLFGLL